MYKKSFTHYATKIVVDILFYLGIIVLIALPFLPHKLELLYGNPNGNLIIYLMISGLFAIYILFQFKKLFKTLLNGNPFIDSNIRCFRKMAVACFLISIVYLIRAILYFSMGTIIIMIVFAIGSLFCLILKDIFKEAINFKSENDLTI